MSENFENLVKLPADPVAKLLSHANVLLKTPLQSPPSAAAGVVLKELYDKEALVDLLRLLGSCSPRVSGFGGPVWQPGIISVRVPTRIPPR